MPLIDRYTDARALRRCPPVFLSRFVRGPDYLSSLAHIRESYAPTTLRHHRVCYFSTRNNESGPLSPHIAMPRILNTADQGVLPATINRQLSSFPFYRYRRCCGLTRSPIFGIVIICKCDHLPRAMSQQGVSSVRITVQYAIVPSSALTAQWHSHRRTGRSDHHQIPPPSADSGDCHSNRGKTVVVAVVHFSPDAGEEALAAFTFSSGPTSLLQYFSQ